MAKKEIKTVGETRKFKMHPDLLFSVIQSQAGTAEKALLEAVMNAVDAGATKCVVNVDDSGYTIEDDGKGFASRKEIDEFFETFGTPHKEGDATYGKFRMGRGQLFAFSKTKWRTNEFEMDVDIKKTGLDYVLNEGLEPSVGCKITGKWYEKMSSNHLFNTLKEFEKLIKYMQIPVIVNGNVVNVDPEKQNWDHKEADFFVKVSDSASVLSVYNMGALVSHYPASKFGVAGTVVTRSALKVNFARNDVLVSQCPLWKKIDKKMREVMGKETKGRTVLKDYQRQAILNSVVSKQEFMSEFMKEGIIEDVSGKKISFKTLLNVSKFAFSTGDHKNKRLEERINDTKILVILKKSVLDTFGCKNEKEFIKKVNELIEHNNKYYEAQVKEIKERNTRGVFENYWQYQTKVLSKFKPEIGDVMTILDTMKKDSSIKDESTLTKQEKAFVKALNTLSEQMTRGICSKQMAENNESYETYNERYEKTLRKVVIGNSESAYAWTDGKTYIAFDEKMIKSSAYSVVHTMLHEYCHNEETMQSHSHGMEFYELYHNISVHDQNDFITNCLLTYQKAYNREMVNAGIKPKAQFDTDIEVMEKSTGITNAMKPSM